jgi:hypothetical protein
MPSDSAVMLRFQWFDSSTSRMICRSGESMQSGDRATARDAYGKFLLMINFSEALGDLRGGHLYLLKKRGVFKTMVSRHYGQGNTMPPSPIFSDLKLSKDAVAELEYRFEALKPYLKQGSPDLA